MDTYTAQVDAVGGSLGLSALVGLVPLVVFFICLVGLKRSAWLSGLIALASALPYLAAAAVVSRRRCPGSPRAPSSPGSTPTGCTRRPCSSGWPTPSASRCG